MSHTIRIAPDIHVVPVEHFNARGLRRCVVPGAGCSYETEVTGVHEATADLWRDCNGAILMRITSSGYSWSYRVLNGSGQPLPDDTEHMEDLTFVVSQKLFRWMTEDAADLPPFDN
ncbi:hypothetical protein [Hydrogenophaga sp.]|uniref:hypothetical protein n=1 Tax=Hydrogenophaga sp. TaxID=1904254 RepID=UPI0027166E69|nr:hypothetical protein [Hydrogenophaga sp.]MDO8905965.1 hypothetical protein [Hydrogenophaga sp.]